MACASLHLVAYGFKCQGIYMQGGLLFWWLMLLCLLRHNGLSADAFISRVAYCSGGWCLFAFCGIWVYVPRRLYAGWLTVLVAGDPIYLKA